ncbi:MAG: transposase, partial [Candidatus Brocadiaceae bacterium]|nr:transposase [Candidatus Brocadiaceae bacterium]
NLDETVFDTAVVLTADTGFSSEDNMEYIFKENIDAVIPDNQFRKRNPVFAESEHYNKHKELRRKTRRDRSKKEAVIPSDEFTVNLSSNTCICPAGKEMLFLGNEFEGAKGTYSRFRGRLKDCRGCTLQTRCMKKPIKDQGRQVSFLNTPQDKTSYLDLMKQKIDSDEGRRKYSRRMWTIEP